MIANILVPLDGSALAERALPYAATLAKTSNARLCLYHVASDVSSPSDVRAELDTAARLEQLAAQLRAQSVQATARTASVNPAATSILGAASDPPADLIVMSTHGHGGLGRWLYGSVADQVLSQANVPVLLVSAACDHPWPQDRPLKILVPLDGSDLSEAALGPARVLSHTLGANLLLVRIVEQDADDAWRFDATRLAIRRMTPDQVQEAQEYLGGIADLPGPTTGPIDVLVDSGDPSSAIATTAAREDIDLIVMATHGRTGLARLTMGSVATTTLQRSHVPILLMRPLAPAQTTSEAPMESIEATRPEVWPPAGVR